MPETIFEPEKVDKLNAEGDVANYFLGLKQTYTDQRKPYEQNWDQALASVYLTDQLDKVYEGRAKIKSPIQNWKVKGITSRKIRILFNVEPIGRLEDKFVKKKDISIPDLWNPYIFKNQLDNISFKSSWKIHEKKKSIYGTSIMKVAQVYEEKKFSFFDEDEKETIVVKDDTYLQSLLIKEFYSDVNKMDINDSAACIHSTTMSMEELRRNEKRKVDVAYELVDPQTGEVVGEETKKEETGIYHNLNLLELGSALTDEQKEYIQLIGLTQKEQTEFQRGLKEAKKTGFVNIDECYGKYVLPGTKEEVEVICVIANGKVIIRLEETPFRHKRYVRPFLVGREEIIENCLYGISNVILGLNLLMELNATRGQAVDAKTRAISHMWYMDTSKSVKGFTTWRPNGIVKGTGPDGLTPLLNPYLGNVSINDTIKIQQDLDQLWSLSPVQEGTSDRSLIPQTAGGTRAVIAQNDMPLNDLIDNSSLEMKQFFEMLYERNLQFKTVEDLKTVWTEQDIQQAGFTIENDVIKGKDGEPLEMKDLVFEVGVRILGNLELSNEIARQVGWNNFIQVAKDTPPIAKRVDWTFVGDRLLESYGIKDDAEGVWLSDEDVAAADKAIAEAQQQQIEGQKKFQEEQRQKAKEDYEHKVETDTEGKVVVEQVKTMGNITEGQQEAITEKVTGQKIA